MIDLIYWNELITNVFSNKNEINNKYNPANKAYKVENKIQFTIPSGKLKLLIIINVPMTPINDIASCIKIFFLIK